MPAAYTSYIQRVRAERKSAGLCQRCGKLPPSAEPDPRHPAREWCDVCHILLWQKHSKPQPPICQPDIQPEFAPIPKPLPKIVKVWSLKRGAITPYEPLSPKVTKLVAAIWDLQDNPIKTKRMTRKEIEWAFNWRKPCASQSISPPEPVTRAG